VLLTVAAVALLVTTAVGWLFGARWWVAELLTNLPIQHALAFAVLTVAAAAVPHRLAVALSLAGLFANLAIATPGLEATHSGDPAPPEADAETLDLTFFNTKYRADRAATIEYLRQRDDDVVVLSLAVGPWREEFEAAALDLAIRAGPGRIHGEDLELIALVRDADADVTVHRPTDDPRDAIVEVVLDLAGQPVHVLASHPVSPLTPARAAQRNRTFERLSARAAAQDAATVVLGDLNATPWSPDLQQLVATGDLIDSQVGFGLQASYPAAWGPLGIAIDHALHTPELTTVARQLGPSLGSDHRMLHATLAPAAPHDDERSQDDG
jgi:endonuclease/exonuclease/phosphatase (EEP) superfamily protein YafD